MLIEALDRILRGAALAAAVLAIALLAGCGGDDDDGSDEAAGSESVAAEQSPADFGEEAEGAERDAAGEVVQGFLGAWGDGDWAKACSLMAASTKRNVELFASQFVKSQDCAEQLEALREQLPAKMLPQPGRIEVTAVRVGEAGGFVLYRDADGTKYAFPVLQEDSAWKAAALVGSKLP